jgi:SAM-dependent methyltransferase
MIEERGTGAQELVEAWSERDARRWTELYHRADVSGVIYQERRDRALSWVDDLDLATGSRVVELGCGAGLLALALAQRGLQVTATDAAPAMVRSTQQHAAGSDVVLHIAQADSNELGLGGGAADVVIALGVLPWLDSPRAALVEAARVLRRGGHLIVSADNRARLTHMLDARYNPLLGPARRAARRLVGRPPRGGPGPKLHWPWELDALLDSVGLEKVVGATVGFGPLTCFGRELPSDSLGLRLNRHLQQLADRGAPGVRWWGSHYLVLARKRQ